MMVKNLLNYLQYLMPELRSRCVFVLFFVACVCTARADNPKDARALQDAYARVAEKAFPAVVVVLNCKYGFSGRLQEHSQGFGFFVRNDGILVTNHHVVEGADIIGVRLLDGKLLPASVIDTSKSADIAVLKVEVDRRVPFLRFADTSKVKVGHCAIAIGAPLSLSHTMTTGVVSFKGRKLGVNNNEDFIQTDTSINPGNSGGPLLSIDGLVIGVNSNGVFRGGGSVGLNFAIDANLVQRILGTALNRGLKNRPQLGVTVEEMRFGDKGVKVTDVIKRSAAEAAGIQVGDIITAIDDNAVKDIFQFQAFVLTNFSSGDSAKFEIVQDGQKKEIRLTFR